MIAALDSIGHRFSGEPVMKEVSSVPDEPLHRSKVAHVLLLAGAVRPNELTRQLGRHVLTLPLRTGYSLLRHWTEMIGADQNVAGNVQTRILTSTGGDTQSVSRRLAQRGNWQVTCDSKPLRGTGGAVRDAIDDLNDDDVVLVADAAQLLYRPLAELLNQMPAVQSDVTVFATPNGGSTFIRGRVGVLRELPAVGYVDLREQSLAMLAKRHRVEVVRWSTEPSLPIRKALDYIEAVALVSGNQAGGARDLGQSRGYAEDWEKRFVHIEIGASVASSAKLHDAVILEGGGVEPGAVVVRSVVGRGGIVAAGSTVRGSVVATPQDGRRSGTHDR